jgi:hypothetical protein
MQPGFHLVTIQFVEKNAVSDPDRAIEKNLGRLKGIEWAKFALTHPLFYQIYQYLNQRLAHITHAGPVLLVGCQNNFIELRLPAKVLKIKAIVRKDDFLDPLNDPTTGTGRNVERCPKFVAATIGAGFDKGRLRYEMFVDVGGRHLKLGCNVSHRHTIKTELFKQLVGSIKNTRTGLFTGTTWVSAQCHEVTIIDIHHLSRNRCPFIFKMSTFRCFFPSLSNLNNL